MNKSDLLDFINEEDLVSNDDTELVFLDKNGDKHIVSACNSDGINIVFKEEQSTETSNRKTIKI